MSALFSFIPWEWIAMAVIGVGGLFLGRSQGVNKERNKRFKGTLDSIKKQREDMADVSQVDDTSLADRLSR